MDSDLHIAQRTRLLPIREISARLGLRDDEVIPYGDYKAKIRLEAIARLGDSRFGRYIVVTGITPTPLGEGKTVTTVGLAQALAHIGHRAACCIRQPSMGPVFGIKGGAAGGGYSQVLPMEDLNLHLTGDMHAVSSAHALLSAMIDTLMVKGNPGRLDPMKVTWRRCVDMNDMALRHIVIGLGGNGFPRETGFDLTSASEVMAVLALARSLPDLRQRLGRIVIGYTSQDIPVFAEAIKAAGAMTVLLKDAIMPNLLQTIEHVPAFVHAGPFANIAHGNSSILADEIALRCVDYVVTEAGFGADMGFEKFCHIKCRTSGRTPDAAVMVATVRAVKAHSGRYRVVPGQPIDRTIFEPSVEALREGLPNLEKHLENVAKFNLPCVVAINRFPSDSDDEIQALADAARAAGAFDVAVSEVHTKGGAGGAALAEAVVRACETQSANDGARSASHRARSASEGAGSFRFLYDLDWPIKKKIETIAQEIYGADGVTYEKPAATAIDALTRLGFANLPICMAKTQYSISHDPTRLGRPMGFRLPVRDIRLAGGAGFLTPLVGTIQTMPAFGRRPSAVDMDVDENGQVVGLF
ncbi:MAG TPA: formate--tetrahydrofolate ligase [Phycisphaerae bacterium]|jgi:formate--tetrahydrofolate ligase|nr:formate--tetrahydrofolate ligase [Phycisphaerae bacterium]HOB73100.1 formate--tetrahydrofolate ligase [Phycisphaerae bacterium]HOJ54019.1 formate--tetrahydrofolate ligase [Phycisphaerae bacterium]HOL26430.1 formate--tetrahydrofolate ligase [Phycisphaerae bacterium]HPP20409.1 formate--tetrahydrofolate ligase [Phycisphaerae bacterium]